MGRPEAGHAAVARRPGQGPAAAARGLRRGRPDRRRRCRSRWSPWWPRPAPPSPWRRACQRPAGAGVSKLASSRLGWYARRAARMSPAEVAWRARDQALRAAWSAAGQARAIAAGGARRQAVRGGSPPSCRRARPTLVPERGPGGGAGGRGPADAGRVGGAGRRPDRPGAAGLVPRPGDRPRLEPDRYAFRINHRSEEQIGNVKQVWEISRLQHLTLLATRLVPQPATSSTRGGWPTSCGPGGGRTRSCPACTGPAASRSASG